MLYPRLLEDRMVLESNPLEQIWVTEKVSSQGLFAPHRSCLSRVIFLRGRRIWPGSHAQLDATPQRGASFSFRKETETEREGYYAGVAH